MQQEERWKKEFEHHIEKASLALRVRVEANRQILHLLRSLFDASDHVDRDEFKVFAESILRGNQEIQALEWIPRIEAKNRLKFKREAIREGFTQFEIREKASNGSLKVAGSRIEYFPVFYLEPMAGNERAFGFDLASDSTRYASLVTARNTARAVATKKIRLVQEKGEQAGVLVFLPVYKGGALPEELGQRQSRIQGFVLGVYRIGDMIEKVLSPFWKQGMGLAIVHGDEGKPDSFLFSKLFPEHSVEKREALEFFGQDWQLIWQGSEEFSLEANPYLPFLVAGIIFVCVFLLAIAFELNLARLQVQTLFDKTVDGIITIDSKSIIRSFNPSSEKLFGYQADEIIGQKVTRLMPEELIEGHENALLKYLKTGEKNIIGTLVEVMGKRKDGKEFPIELGIAEFKSIGTRLFTGSIRDITDRKNLENELEALSQTDALTGINNRRSFDMTIEKEWNRARRNAAPLSLILIDIDYFKKYNDTYGHVAGDECLRTVASALGSSLNRASDFLARYGGEEFVAILPGTGAAQAMNIAEMIRYAVLGLEIPHSSSGVGTCLTISLGIATADKTQDRESGILVEAADKALYQAKQEGRNRSVATTT